MKQYKALLWNEIKKLISGTSLWVLIALCIALNVFVTHVFPDTYATHENLFNEIPIAGVMGIVLLQGIILALITSLLSFSHEQANNTEHVIYTTKTGRKVARIKIAASLITGVGLYAMLTVIALTYYFFVHEYSNWVFFWAWIGVSIGVVICFSFMGAIAGIVFINGYLGFIAAVLVNFVSVAPVMLMAADSRLRRVLLHTPAWLWRHSGLWFTGGGDIALRRNFELLGVGISLLVLAVFFVAAVKLHEKRDIT